MVLPVFGDLLDVDVDDPLVGFGQHPFAAVLALGQFCHFPQRLDVARVIPHVDDVSRFLDPPLLEAALLQLGRNHLGIGNVGDLPFPVEAPVVERAAQVIALDRGFDSQMRAKMRAERIDRAQFEILAAPHDEFGAEIAQRLDVAGLEFIRKPDSEPAKWQAQAFITTLKRCRGFHVHDRHFAFSECSRPEASHSGMIAIRKAHYPPGIDRGQMPERIRPQRDPDRSRRNRNSACTAPGRPSSGHRLRPAAGSSCNAWHSRSECPRSPA